jgi:hypothetical protein
MSSYEDALANLEDVTGQIREAERRLEDLGYRRDELIRSLMGTKSVPRKEIAAAAGLKEPRLYQIRDGRR